MDTKTRCIYTLSKWQPIPVLLPGKFHGWRSLVGYSPWSRKESNTAEQLHFTRNHFRPKDIYILKVRGRKNIFHADGKQKKAGVAILISDKIDLKIKKITSDKEGHYIMIKGSIQEEDITIVNIYSPNIGAPQYIRRILTDIKGETDINTMTAGDFNIPLTPMDRSSK